MEILLAFISLVENILSDRRYDGLCVTSLKVSFQSVLFADQDGGVLCVEVASQWKVKRREQINLDHPSSK